MWFCFVYIKFVGGHRIRRYPLKLFMIAGNKNPSPQKGKKGAIFLLKLAFGIFLLVALFVWQGDWREILALFTKVSFFDIVFLVFMALLMNFVSCLKWQLFLKEQKNHVSVFRLFSLYCIGRFFDNFFPSTVGGDVARGYLLGRQINSHGKSFASVLLERLTGLVALVFIVFVVALFNHEFLRQPVVAISCLFMGVATICGTVLLLYPSLITPFSGVISKLPFLEKIVVKINTLHEEASLFARRPMLLAKSMAYSCVFYFMAIIQVYMACRAIGFEPDFWDIGLVVPIILLLASVPLSPGKLGVWEWAFSIFLLQAGGGVAEGMAVALLLRGVELVVSAGGGVLLLWEKLHKSS